MMDIIGYLNRKEHIRTFIITNGPPENQRKKIDYLGLDKYFSKEQIIVSGEESVAKPNPKLFRIAEERFQINREKVWYIGDSYENDIIGAYQAGWKSIWIDHQNRSEVLQDGNLATVTVKSPAELKEYILKNF